MCLEKLKKRFDNQKRKRLDREEALEDLVSQVRVKTEGLQKEE